uniref:T-complex protein 1 subunit alpha (Trinotate prediction) n=1 Tax=Henneguya salminicola TaxID=69463 RepID=A0A6G3MMH7_HENSL
MLLLILVILSPNYELVMQRRAIIYTPAIYGKVIFYILRYGLDLEAGDIRNNLEAGVLEPTMSKVKMLKFATEAAITILRIDECIKLAPEKKDPREEEDMCH